MKFGATQDYAAEMPGNVGWARGWDQMGGDSWEAEAEAGSCCQKGFLDYLKLKGVRNNLK